MVGEVQPVEDTNLLWDWQEETLSPVLWTLLCVWFKYWVQGHSPALVSSPWTTVALRQLVSLQPAAAVPFRKAKSICHRDKI